MTKFNKENMIKWAEALESGRYKQCHGSWGQETYDDGEIINQGKFCCLNVALMEFTGKDIGENSRESQLNYFNVIDSTLSQILHPDWYIKDLTNLFIKMNDDQKLTFPEIAKGIRKMIE